MKKEWKEKWVHALKNGEYKKGDLLLKDQSPRGYVYNELGVLADLLAKEGFGEWEINPPDGRIAFIYNGIYRFNMLQDSAYSRVGLSYREERALREHFYSISGRPRNHTFEEVADWIEKNVGEAT